MLRESHCDIPCLARSKQHNGKPEANSCVGIYLSWSRVPVLNHIASDNISLVKLCHKDITATAVTGEIMITMFNGILSQRKLI